MRKVTDDVCYNVSVFVLPDALQSAQISRFRVLVDITQIKLTDKQKYYRDLRINAGKEQMREEDVFSSCSSFFFLLPGGGGAQESWAGT